MQWLQVATPVLQSNSDRLTLEQSLAAPLVVKASWLSLLAVLCFAAGARLALLRLGESPDLIAERQASEIRPSILFVFWVLIFLLTEVASRILFSVPGLTQIIGSIRSIKWVIVFLIGYGSFNRRRGYFLFGLVVVIELAYGFTQFFSGFRSIFSLVLIILLTGHRLLARRLPAIAGIALSLLVASIFWTAIKPAYREFLNKGSQEQEVLVTMGDRFKKLRELFTGLDRDDVKDATKSLKQRIGYVEFFALTLDYVPQNTPHEKGRLWLDAIIRPFMPRLFFPNKSQVHDSYRTEMYTGTKVAGPDEGASIGIGYIAESYVDFGYYFMFLPILLLGALCGLIYRLCIYRFKDVAFGFAMATAIVIFNASAIETSNIKLIGGLAINLLMGLAFYRFIWPGIRALAYAPLDIDQLKRKRSNRPLHRNNANRLHRRRPAA